MVTGKGHISIGPHQRDSGANRDSSFQYALERFEQLPCRFRRGGIGSDQQQEPAADSVTATEGIIEVAHSWSFDDWASTISNAQFRKPLNKCVLKRGEARDHRDECIT